MPSRTDKQESKRARKKAPPAKKTTRVKRGSALMSRDRTSRVRTSIQSLRRRRAALGVDVVALGVIGFGILLLLSVLSYHPADTRVGTWGVIESDAAVHNWVGPFGAAIAEGFISLFGVTSFLLPLLLVLSTVSVLGRRSRRPRVGDIAGLLGVATSLAMLVHLAFPDVPFRGDVVPGGGWFGELLAGLFVSQVSTIGSWVIGLTLLGVSARLAFGMQPLTMGRAAGRKAGAWLSVAAARVAGWLRGVLGASADGVGTAGRGVREAWEDWRHEVKLRREERSWEREERRLEMEEERLERELAEDDSIGLDSAIHAPAPSRRDSRVRRPKQPSITPAPAPAPTAEVLAPVEILDEASLVAEPAPFEPEPVEEVETDPGQRVDSMRGATQRGVVHAVIEVGKGGGRSQAAPAAKVPSPNDSKPRIQRAAPKDDAAVKVVERVVSARRFIRLRNEPFELPPLSLLNLPPAGEQEVDEEELEAQAARLEETLQHYGVVGRVTDILPGPVVTMFEFEPEPGIKVSKIANLGDDLAMALRAVKVRIVAPIPGKGAVGIEIPSAERETVFFREMLASSKFRKARMRLPLALGKAIDGSPVCSDMAKMPHILVAGTTGSGKSVCVNTVLLSLLFRLPPNDLRLILVDPKMLEFSIYDGIPHLLVPVVTSAKKAAAALHWAVREMERRYKVLSAMSVRNIAGYNAKAEQLQAEWETYEKSLPTARPLDKPDCGRAPGEDTVCFRSHGDDPVGPPDRMPSIVIIIDELADLMMVARKEVEESIVRLAQMARAAGIHMLLATQRPSVDVITGLIKANFPTRLSFKVSSKIDSRTVLDTNGAENLLGLGDGLFLPPGTSELTRVHGAFVSDDEVQRVVDHLKTQGEPQYVDAVLTSPDEEGGAAEPLDVDDMYDECVAVVAQEGKASTSLLQRRLKLGYNRAARIMDQMEAQGVIGPQDGARPREVFVKPYDF